MTDETPTKLFIRTKRKDTEYKDDLHHFTNEWQEVEIGRVRGDYIDEPNLDVRDKPGGGEVKPAGPVLSAETQAELDAAEKKLREAQKAEAAAAAAAAAKEEADALALVEGHSKAAVVALRERAAATEQRAKDLLSKKGK